MSGIFIVSENERDSVSIKALSEMPSKELAKTFLASQALVIFWLLIDYLMGDLPPVGKPFGFFWTLLVEITFLAVSLAVIGRKFLVFYIRRSKQ